MKLFQTLIVLVCVGFLASCKEDYEPKVKSSEQSVLVVEGVLSPNGASNIRLTKSFKLDDTSQLQYEGGARVYVEGKSGSAFDLYEFSDGNYTVDHLPLDVSDQYRLHIRTKGGDEYASDFLPVLQNPPLDSVNWKRDADGVRIFANTHNEATDTGYYRWEYEETWETHAGYLSHFKMQDGKVVGRMPGDEVYKCWHYHNSSNIFLFSTAQLASNVVSERPLLQIPAGSEKLSERYSVLVRQYALNKQGYAFYQLMQKNTESLGSIFDAQPSEVSGNIHALSGGNRALGFITIAPVQETRIFINSGQVPGWGFQMYCSVNIEIKNDPDSIQKYFASNRYWPYEDHKEGFLVVGYYASFPECTDCTFLGGGVTTPPSYW